MTAGQRLGVNSAAFGGVIEARIRDLLAAGTGIVKTARLAGVGVAAVQRIKATIAA